MFRREKVRERIRTVRTFVLPDGILAVVAEGDENPVDEEDNAKFLRWVRTPPAAH